MFFNTLGPAAFLLKTIRTAPGYYRALPGHTHCPRALAREVASSPSAEDLLQARTAAKPSRTTCLNPIVGHCKMLSAKG